MVRPHNHAERRRAQLCFQTATVLWTLYGDSDEVQTETEMEDLLVYTAGETLIRRQLFLPGELRFSIGRLESLFSQVGSFTDTVMNIVGSFRFRIQDLARLRAGAQGLPSRVVARAELFVSRHLIGLRIPEVFSTTTRYRFSGDEGLLLLLFKLHWPARVLDVAHQGGRGISAASECFSVCTPALFLAPTTNWSSH